VIPRSNRELGEIVESLYGEKRPEPQIKEPLEPATAEAAK
jgi:hypothetical protein